MHGSERSGRQYLLQTNNPGGAGLDLLTVLSGVAKDHIRFRPWSELIPGLDFDFIRHICFGVGNDVFGPRSGHVIPV